MLGCTAGFRRMGEVHRPLRLLLLNIKIPASIDGHNTTHSKGDNFLSIPLLSRSCSEKEKGDCGLRSYTVGVLLLKKLTCGGTRATMSTDPLVMKWLLVQTKMSLKKVQARPEFVPSSFCFSPEQPSLLFHLLPHQNAREWSRKRAMKRPRR